MREASITRTTKETDIRLSICLDGKGTFEGTSGIGFFDHMLTLFAAHGGFDLKLSAKGDLEVDNHHTVEDIGICLGQAIAKALGDKSGITRYGTFFCPMDEALSRIVLDLSGRPYLVFDVDIAVERIGTFETEMVREFFLALASNSGMTLHIACLYGVNGHHIVESLFKGFGHALGEAVSSEKIRASFPRKESSYENRHHRLRRRKYCQCLSRPEKSWERRHRFLRSPGHCRRGCPHPSGRGRHGRRHEPPHRKRPFRIHQGLGRKRHEAGRHLPWHAGPLRLLHGRRPRRRARLPSGPHRRNPRCSGAQSPHMGWNELVFARDHWISRGLPAHPYVYFVHSYYKVPADTEDVIATADYGVPIPAIVGKGNVIGLQFHPEKSGAIGALLLRNILEWFKL